MLARLIRLGLSSMLEWVVGGYGRPVGAEGGAVDLPHFFHLHQKHPALPVAVAIYSFPSFLLAQLKSMAVTAGCVHTGAAVLYLLKCRESQS